MVAPIRMMVPFSTWGRKASCWALLKRWISSTNRIVRVLLNLQPVLRLGDDLAQLLHARR